MKKIALILSGGKGNRFWPKSTTAVPKQFLHFPGGETLFGAMYKRIKTLISPEDIYVITGAAYRDIVLQQAPGIKAHNLILEPCGRDTAPALVYAFEWLAAKYGEATVLVAPADLYISEQKKWEETVETAFLAAELDCPVVIGIQPTRPETGYGYLLPGEPEEQLAVPVRRVRRFLEKPDYERAVRLLESGPCFWNSGMFVWKISVFRKKAAFHLPSLYLAMQGIVAEMSRHGLTPAERNMPQDLAEDYGRVTPISIDYGLLEKCDDIRMVEGAFPWDDVGSWLALERLYPSDQTGNIVLGEGVFLLEDKNCLVDWSQGKMLVIGLENTVIAGHNKMTFICAKESLHLLKEALSRFGELQEEEKEETEVRIVPKPWGREIWWAVNDKYAAKILEFKAGHSTSFHLHKKKHETFYIEKGKGSLILTDREEKLFPGKVAAVAPQVAHRIAAVTDLRLFEVSTPEVDDVVRLVDYYHRTE